MTLVSNEQVTITAVANTADHTDFTARVFQFSLSLEGEGRGEGGILRADNGSLRRKRPRPNPLPVGEGTFFRESKDPDFINA